MSFQPSPEDIAKFHRYFAAQCNNRAWDLASQNQRTADEEREMLNAAYAAAFHWSKVGTPINDARADMTLAHVHSLLGNGDQALYYAGRCLSFFEQNEGEDWDLAFAHAEMALATATCGDHDTCRKHVALAQETGATIKNDEDRKAFDEEFARISQRVVLLRQG